MGVMAQETEAAADVRKVACGACTLAQLCLPVGIDEAGLTLLDHAIRRHRPIRRRSLLFQAGQPFRSLYAVRSGSVKTFLPAADGGERITGFRLPGELLGLDAIHSGRHPCAARALESTSVCELPFERFESLCGDVPTLLRRMLRIMSQEILQEEGLLAQISNRSGEQRLVAFLLNLSARFRRRGFSAREFNLSMSRADIGNYLGLAKETVSRLFARLQAEGLIQVAGRQVRLLDELGLHRRLAGD